MIPVTQADTPQYSYYVEPRAASKIPVDYLSECIAKAIDGYPAE